MQCPVCIGKRTDAGATQTVTHAIVVDTASGAVGMAVIAALAADLDVAQNIQPQFAAGDLMIVAE